jgi:hypothetical protein
MLFLTFDFKASTFGLVALEFNFKLTFNMFSSLQLIGGHLVF